MCCRGLLLVYFCRTAAVYGDKHLGVGEDAAPRHVERPLRKLIAEINNPKDTAQETNLSSLISESQPEAASQGKTFPFVFWDTNRI